MGDDASPRLRAIEAFPVETEEGPLICLRDPQRYSESQVFVSQAAVPILALMDGTNSIRDIQLALTRASGQLVMSDEISRLVEQLDELYFLETPRFRSFKRQVDQSFGKAATRAAALAGQSYPADPGELAEMLESFFDGPDGPGPPAGSRPALAAVVAPHIDYPRGGAMYAHAYRALAEGVGRADTFLILATSHQPMSGYFALTQKDFETPLGVVSTDRGFVSELADALASTGVEPYEDEAAHRTEHAAEFQVVFLQHLFGGKRDFRIVPVLVGSFHELLTTGGGPADDPSLMTVVEAIRAGVDTRGGRVVVVAGVDLAHVGPQFGDEETVDEAGLERLRSQDQEMLELLRAGDASGFWENIRRDGDARHVCGFPPLMAMLLALQPGPGELLGYAQYYDPAATVTFAGLAFPRRVDPGGLGDG